MLCSVWRLTDSESESLPSLWKKVFRCYILIKKPVVAECCLAGVRSWNCVFLPSLLRCGTYIRELYLPAALWISHVWGEFLQDFVYASLTVCSFLSKALGIHYFHLVIYNILQVFSSRTVAEQVVAHVFMQWICLCLSVFLVAQFPPLSFTLVFRSFYKLRKYWTLSLTSRILEFDLVWECVFSFS